MKAMPLKLHGAKSYLAKWIVSMFPEHTHYCEPFFGAGHVLFRKSSTSVSEVVNDINDNLMNFWDCVRLKETREVMVKHLMNTPMSEEEFKRAEEILSNSSNPVSRAIAFFIRYRQSRQGLAKDFATLSRTRIRRGMNEQASQWMSAIEGFEDAAARLSSVVIMNKDAIDFINQQDGEQTFFYCDPPYHPDTRVSKDSYEHEMSADEHMELLEVLSNIKGKFALSGYDNELYRNYEDACSWKRTSRVIKAASSSKTVKDERVEVLWMNYSLDGINGEDNQDQSS